MIGPQRPNDRRGWLIFDSLPADLQAAEDATLGADHERLLDSMSADPFSRAATDTERQLLAHLGYTVPADLATRVHWLSPGVRNRRWPQLEGN
jgi:hypothetical protein